MHSAPIAFEPYLLVGSLLMLAGIIAGKVGTRFGVPALLLFLITGMLFGSAGLGIQYNDTHKTQFVGMIALTVILFFGGFETKLTEIRPVLGPGIILSTVGVLLTTLCLGSFFYGMDLLGWAPVHFTFPIALLLAATMSSTDSASVFALSSSWRAEVTTRWPICSPSPSSSSSREELAEKTARGEAS